jgi:DnaJ-related protein SCJ1
MHHILSMVANCYGHTGGHSGHSQQTRKGPNMVMEMEIDLQDVYTGKTYDITIQRKQICDHCTGTGAKSRDDIVQCDVCQGRGIRIVKHML